VKFEDMIIRGAEGTSPIFRTQLLITTSKHQTENKSTIE